MENQILWGEVPTQRKKKEEKYTTPVVTLAAIEKAGAGRKISFNKAAQELLSIKGEDSIAFGFTTDGEHIYVRKWDKPGSFKLTQVCTISDKRTYEFIIKRNGLTLGNEYEFDLESRGEFCELILRKEEVAFPNTDLGVVTEEVSLEADLDALPEVPEGGATYVGDEVVMQEFQEDIAQVPAPEVEVEMPFDDESIETAKANTIPVVEPVQDTKRVKFAIDNTVEDEVVVPTIEEEDEEDEW